MNIYRFCHRPAAAQLYDSTCFIEDVVFYSKFTCCLFLLYFYFVVSAELVLLLAARTCPLRVLFFVCHFFVENERLYIFNASENFLTKFFIYFLLFYIFLIIRYLLLKGL